MKTKYFLTLLIALTLLAATQVLAAQSSFSKSILQIEKSCPTLYCSEIQIYSQMLSPQEKESLPTNLQVKFNEVSQRIAEDEWPDTILEGPYVAQLKIQILHITRITQKSQLIGYLVTYSDKAWDTDTCNFDPRFPDSLNSCTEGTLVESAFVSVDFQDYVRDPLNYVEFVQP